MKSILLALLIAAVVPWSVAAAGQNPPESSIASDQGKKIFISQCAKCHDADASKKLPDGTTLLARLAKNRDPETRLATRLKNEQERHQVFLYLQPMIERERLSGTRQGSVASGRSRLDCPYKSFVVGTSFALSAGNSASNALRSRCRVYMASFPSGVCGHSSLGRSQYSSTPLPSGSRR